MKRDLEEVAIKATMEIEWDAVTEFAAQASGGFINLVDITEEQYAAFEDEEGKEVVS